MEKNKTSYPYTLKTFEERALQFLANTARAIIKDQKLTELSTREGQPNIKDSILKYFTALTNATYAFDKEPLSLQYFDKREDHGHFREFKNIDKDDQLVDKNGAHPIAVINALFKTVGLKSYFPVSRRK